jgi:predicted DNA binding CopG/RHH family protein
MSLTQRGEAEMVKIKGTKTPQNMSSQEQESVERAMRETSPAEDWERGRLGRDQNFVETVSLNKGKRAISIKAMPDELVNDLKRIAETKHLAYQTLIKMVCQEYVDEWKRKKA